MKPRILLAVAAFFLASTPLLADKWPAPTPRVFASRWGSHGFKLRRPEFGGASEGVLFRLDADGQERIVWRAPLVNTPHQVVVDDSGAFVATIDTYGILGYAHSLVIYGEEGRLIRDFKLEELLTKEEIESRVNHSASSRVWADKADIEIASGQLAVRLPWERTIQVELATGKIVAPEVAGEGAETRTAGLIGTAKKDGEATQIAYHYPHGKVFPPALIRDQFHDGELNRPSVQIELFGLVEVPDDIEVEIYHAAGGVNMDHGTLYLDDRQLGQVGDDLAKHVVYTMTLPQGTHRVRWVLTGGTFQANLLKFQNAKTGELLSMYHTARQREETGASRARKTIDAQGELEGWPPDFQTWKRVSID